MHDRCECRYKYLAPWRGSNYKQFFFKDRKIRALTLYEGTLEPEARTPEEIAAEFNVPVEAVNEAIHYCTHHQDVLQSDHEMEEASTAGSVLIGTPTRRLRIMRLYLDDNSYDRRLLAALRGAGHDVIIPVDVGRSGASDAKHLAAAFQHNAAVLTRDHEDFSDLHELILLVGGHHFGILVVRSEKDRRRRMTFAASGAPIENHFHILNQWG